MDQHDGGRNAQPPAKDFLALTHGQEWVNFYESFDKLVQDHLSRSSELLRRAMSLPEVADREVQQVRSELEGKLAAERSRSQSLLSQLHSEISASHDHVTQLAAQVNDVASSLSSLSSRVADALSSLDGVAPAAMAASAPAAAISAAPFDGEPVGDDSAEIAPFNFAADLSAAPDNGFAADPIIDEVPALIEDILPETDAEIASEPMTASDESASAMAEPLAAEQTGDTIEGALPEADIDASAERFDAETGLDLSALAAAEEHRNDDATASDDDQPMPMTGTGSLDPDAVGAGAGDRPRPHWLSVTRIGSRP